VSMYGLSTYRGCGETGEWEDTRVREVRNGSTGLGEYESN
jgi:hypothetical protein